MLCQYWDGGYGEAEKILGIKFSDFPHNTKEKLINCYVFFYGTADTEKLREMIRQFELKNPGYIMREYDDYEEQIKARFEGGQDDE